MLTTVMLVSQWHAKELGKILATDDAAKGVQGKGVSSLHAVLFHQGTHVRSCKLSGTLTLRGFGSLVIKGTRVMQEVSRPVACFEDVSFTLHAQ